MKNVIVTPAAHRPEFLALALERLSVIPHCPDIHIYVDAVADARWLEYEYVYEKFAPRGTGMIRRKPHISAPSGCWNILHSIKDGYDLGADLIFLVEEDVMVYPHWYQDHLAHMTSGKYLATIGRRDEHHFWTYGPMYTNPGSCLRRDLVKKMIPHINDDYFTNLRRYLDRELPPAWDEQSELDDGLVRRVIRQMHGTVQVPEIARCRHQGFALYNRIDIYTNRGSIQERIAGLRKLLATIKPSDRYCPDFEPY